MQCSVIPQHEDPLFSAPPHLVSALVDDAADFVAPLVG